MDAQTEKVNHVKYVFDVLENLLLDAEKYGGYCEGEFVRTFILNVLVRDFENCRIPERVYICFETKEQCLSFMEKWDDCLRFPGIESEIDHLGNKCYRRCFVDKYMDKVIDINFIRKKEYLSWDILNNQVKYIPSQKQIRAFSLPLTTIYSDARKNIIRLSNACAECLYADSQEDKNYIEHFTKNYSNDQSLYYGGKAICIPCQDGNVTEEDVVKYFREILGKNECETCNCQAEAETDKDVLQIAYDYILKKASNVEYLTQSDLEIIPSTLILEAYAQRDQPGQCLKNIIRTLKAYNKMFLSKQETQSDYDISEKKVLRDAVDFVRRELAKRSLFIENYSISKDNIFSAYHNRHLESSQNKPLMNILSQIQ